MRIIGYSIDHGITIKPYIYRRKNGLIVISKK
jgi:hypothetical protein